MKAILIVLLAALACVAAVSHDDEVVVTQALVDDVIAKKPLWTPSINVPHAKLTRAEVRRYLGVNPNVDPTCTLPKKSFTSADLSAAPDAFDARTAYPQCPSVSQVRDQSDCGSCWAFGAVESMSDRNCIHGNDSVSLSAEDMNSCSGLCGSCNGGRPECAYKYWLSTGVVSEDCYPYSLPSCDHHNPDSKNPCPDGEYPTPACKKTCTGNNKKTYAKDKHFGSKAYTVSGEKNMMTELSSLGPCEAAIDVYEDFETYKSGIYHHVSGKYLGGHAIRILGYGVENGVKYWLLANSWNENWGEKGYFRMLRGTNECSVESAMNCGLPKNSH